MHMADALISPAVGGALWAATAGLIAFCARKVSQALRDNLVPMMGVLGAFVFAAQMINFSIPGTGSSGHLTGGLILAILLGPYAAFLVIASVITIQALFFADGGLLALGCNIFNMGFWATFVAYPLVYRPIAGDRHGTLRAWGAAVASAVVGLQMGALSVVLQTNASGISELPFGAFALLMQPIHLAIGVVEGLATAAVASFVAVARPEAFAAASAGGRVASLKPILAWIAIAAVITAGGASWFASTQPDGLEWSIAGVSRKAETSGGGPVHAALARLQEKTAFLPDYGFRSSQPESAGDAVAAPERWPAVDAGTSAAGLVGGLITLAMASLVGLAIKARSMRHNPKTAEG